MADAEEVQATNDDATECKRCAVDMNYWKDPFIPFFIKHYNRKSPEINRGYFARVTGVNNMVNKFLQVTPFISVDLVLFLKLNILFQWKYFVCHAEMR